MPITKSSQQLVAEAMAQVKTYSVEDVKARLNDPRVQVVDIRDVRELEREGTVPGRHQRAARHARILGGPGIAVLQAGVRRRVQEFILFCGAGWRSALAAQALQAMGMTNVAHIDGGFTAWVKQGAPVETYEQHKARRHAKA